MKIYVMHPPPPKKLPRQVAKGMLMVNSIGLILVTSGLIYLIRLS